MKADFDFLPLVQNMRAMVCNSEDVESLWSSYHKVNLYIEILRQTKWQIKCCRRSL